MAAAIVNGSAESILPEVNEAVEYEKILKLRDQIFAGTHPRLAIPNRAFEKASSIPATQSSTASHPNVPPFLSFPKSSQLPGLGRGSEEPAQEQYATFVVDSQSTMSGIDPVLLTKSDDLVRAELRLLRPRLEKTLRDQFEQKRLDARKRPAQGEGKPDFDVAAVLAKALEVAKPDTTDSPGGDDASVSSFDENSLYSSRAPDSTPEAGELEEETGLHQRTSFAEAPDQNDAVEIRTPHHKMRLPIPPPTSGPRAEYDPLNPGLGNFSGPGNHTVDNDDEDEEEGEYSPPEAMEHDHTAQDQVVQPLDPRSRPLRRYSDVENGRPGSPNDGNFRIVRNHITSLAAPQPSRVSLLAEAKDSIVSQNNRTRNGRQNQRNRRDQSPEAPDQGLHPRKKRKLEKQNARRRRGGGSPDVKDEPISPPPFHEVQPLGSGRLRPAGNEPILIDDGPHEVRYVRANEQYLDSPTRPMSRVVEPMMPFSEPRTSSRVAMQPIRDDTNLRRVASLHNMRVEQPRYVEQMYDSPTRARATPYMPSESSMHSESLRYPEDMPIAYERGRGQGARVVRTPAPVYQSVYQDAEPEIHYVSQPMPPPPPPPQPMERIIIDEYGRKFREIIQEATPAVSRTGSIYGEREQVGYEGYNQPGPSSVMIGGEIDDRRLDSMPPPRMLRHAADTPRHEFYETRPVGRAVSVAAVDRPMTRQSVYLDDGRQDRVPTRVGSVRPVQSHYEDRAPTQMLPRSGSVRPVVREGSVFIEDRPPARREYVQMEPTQHQMGVPHTRYIDAHGREVVMGGGQHEATRYYQGY